MVFSKKFPFVLLLTLFSLNFVLSLQAQEKEDMVMNLITMVYSVTAYEDLEEIHFLTYSPIITDESIPIYVKLPKDGLFNLKVTDINYIDVKDDLRLIRFTLKNCKKDEKNYIAYEFYTLKKISNYEDLSKNISLRTYSNLSDDLRYYLQPSLTIQSDSYEIRRKAYEFLYGCWNVGNVIDVIERIMDFTGNDIIHKTRPGGQTALVTLNSDSGVCTGKANLAVGLCRALGIPARVLHVLPTHFITQIWIPDYGWVRGESTKGIFPDPMHIWTVAWIVDIDDENHAGRYSDGVVAYLGLDDEVNAKWNVEFEEIGRPDRWIEDFVFIDSEKSTNEGLFEKGAELWRYFCKLMNLGLSDEQLAIFTGYHKLYFDDLVARDTQSAIQHANFAISEAKRILNQ
jgi:hypothetical protein